MLRMSLSGVRWLGIEIVERILDRLPANSKFVFFLALLLAAIFLTAQLHCCVYAMPGAIDSHVCPVCCTVGAAIATCALFIATGLLVRRMEIRAVLAPFHLVIFRNLTPRAPPVPC